MVLQYNQMLLLKEHIAFDAASVIKDPVQKLFTSQCIFDLAGTETPGNHCLKFAVTFV
jgi:hypothetical protein